MPNSEEIDAFVEEIIIEGARDSVKGVKEGEPEMPMPCFFTFGETDDGGEIGVMPITGDVSEPRVKAEIIGALKQLKKEKPYHTVIFVSDTHFKMYEGKTSKEAMAEREKFDGRLSEDPESKEAIVVAKITAKGGSTTMIEYKRTDDGIEFQEPQEQIGIHSSWMTRIWDEVN